MDCYAWQLTALVLIGVDTVLLVAAAAWWYHRDPSRGSFSPPSLSRASSTHFWRREVFTRSMKPPTCKATPAWSRFAMFISHCKAEAGSDARYLSELLSRMLHHRVFLDATDLHDLRRIAEAVQQSDVLLCLTTATYLLRPFCLVEVLEAYKARVPMLLVLITTSELDLEDLHTIACNLRAELSRRAPATIITLRQLAAIQKVSFDDFMELMQEAVKHLLYTSGQSERLPMLPLRMGSDESTSGMLTWDSNGSHNAIVADAQEIIEKAATATSRTLEWDKREVDLHNNFIPSPSDSPSGRGAPTRGWLPFGRRARKERQLLLTELPPAAATSSELLLLPEPSARVKFDFSRKLRGDGVEPAAGGGGGGGGGGAHPIAYVFSCDHTAPRAVDAAKALAKRLAAGVAGHMLVASLEARLGGAAAEGGDVAAWLADAVTPAKGLVLLQTRRVLLHPVTLAEVFHADQQAIPVCCLNLVGGGYSFVGAQQHLASLTAEKLRQQPTGGAVLEWLAQRGVPFARFKWALYASIPSILSIRYAPSKSVHHQKAVTLDLRERLRILKGSTADNLVRIEAQVDSLISLEQTMDAFASHMAVLRVQAWFRGRKERAQIFKRQFFVRVVQMRWRAMRETRQRRLRRQLETKQQLESPSSDGAGHEGPVRTKPWLFMNEV